MSRISDGFPGDFIGDLPVNAFIQPAGLPINTSRIEVLRRPVEYGQYTSIHFAETLALEGVAASIGSIGDAYDNALAESTIGLFKNEAIRDDSPFRSGPLKGLDEVEWVTMAWVDWYNSRRLHSTLGDVPPDEYEASYYAALSNHSQPEMEPA